MQIFCAFRKGKQARINPSFSCKGLEIITAQPYFETFKTNKIVNE